MKYIYIYIYIYIYDTPSSLISYPHLEQAANTRNCRQKLQMSEGNAMLLQAWPGSSGSRRLRLPEFLENRNTKVAVLSVLRIGSINTPSSQ